MLTRFIPSVAIVLLALLVGVLPIAVESVADDADANADHPAAPEDNPYLAPPDLSIDELAAFIEKMQRKPETIRSRPGFVAAILDAANRILAAPADGGTAATDDARASALLAKFESLHLVAVQGDQPADDQLFKLAAECKDHAREAIAQEARFHLLEQRALAVDALPAAELPALVEELQAWFAATPPSDRHLRLASATVRAVNLLPDKSARNKAFDELGATLSKSVDRKMSRYGKSIAKADRTADLVGQPLEIEGVALDGLPFDWSKYRGKVVLVDFWATWCGPCIGELPNVRANYEKYHDQGFEVVGISLDADRAALDTFLQQNPVPWVNLFDPTATEGWNNPNAVKYGVKAIPFPILVDVEGKVVTLAARGPALGEHLEKLLGK